MIATYFTSWIVECMREKISYESKLTFFTRIALLRDGSEKLVDSGLLETLAESSCIRNQLIPASNNAMDGE